MSYYNAPHFDLPFRLRGSSFVTVEQDTLDDVANCVIASLRTPQGQRPQAPSFGSGDMLLFQQQPVDLSSLSVKVAADEPRATQIMSQQPSLLDVLVANVTDEVTTKEGQ